MQVPVNTLLHLMKLVTSRKCQIVGDILLSRSRNGHRNDGKQAKYFTYDTTKSRCLCFPHMDLDVTRQEKSGKISGNVDCKIAGEQCYLEMDVVYKADKAGLDHLDIGKQASAEECRDWCRYL